MSAEKLVEVRNLNVTFKAEEGPVYAVSDVSFDLAAGETLALLGESGCGKSVTMKSLMRLHPAHKTRIEGQVKIDGVDLLAMRPAALSALRGKTVSMVFQEPMLAFDPVFTIGDQIAESVRRHEGCSYAEGRKRALEMLERVRIPSAAKRLDAYPHEMSGGMRQRAMIALALACKPKILLADEPTTALDATVQIQVLLLLKELQRELGMSMIFVTHDVGVAIEVADRTAVMYAGRIIEEGPVDQVLSQPWHPYTQGLLAATVHPGMNRSEALPAIPGSPPQLTRQIQECAFAPRCRYRSDACLEPMPAAYQADNRAVRCIHALTAEAV
ncbi:MAG: ABC transporter ATP-binding protein [Nitrincola lacisaponensis]|uniref:ABC-type dipeptide transporter n=1 Tax=Nitrincola lacisaponensis TaxID=267850 RepID=A0A063Y1J7_9GAMM|nr:ABC transporter ATP-binding protein [Nitrincola lacisaponensis]KDE40198.1 Oligopeptide transport system permease protein OppB [Nitrincola lacisaponensis]